MGVVSVAKRVILFEMSPATVLTRNACCVFRGSTFMLIRSIMICCIWSEWRLTVIAATVRIALVDILDLSEVDIPAGVFLHPTVGWG